MSTVKSTHNPAVPIRGTAQLSSKADAQPALSVTSAKLFFYNPAAQFARLTTMSTVAANEPATQTAARHACFYLANLCTLYNMSGPVVTPLPPAVKKHETATKTFFDQLMDYVDQTGNLTSVVSLYLTLWNSAALAGDITRTRRAHSIWKAKIAAAPSSDIPTACFYDSSTSTLYVAPASSFATLAANATVASDWTHHRPFASEIAKLAVGTYSSPFATTATPGGGQTSAQHFKPRGILSDWWDAVAGLVGTVGVCGLVAVGTAATFGLSDVFGGMACFATAEQGGKQIGDLINDYRDTPDNTTDTDIPDTDVPDGTPVDDSDGNTYAPPSDPGDSTGDNPGGGNDDPGPDPDPDPDPGPDPDPNPDPNPGPDPDPNPGPDPSPDPSPDPGPEPSPEPSPDPGPGPSPDPSPDPGPDPSPDPSPDPGPGPIFPGPDPGPHTRPNVAEQSSENKGGGSNPTFGKDAAPKLPTGRK
jgi:hypothetical protein